MSGGYVNAPLSDYIHHFFIENSTQRSVCGVQSEDLKGNSGYDLEEISKEMEGVDTGSENVYRRLTTACKRPVLSALCVGERWEKGSKCGNWVVYRSGVDLAVE